MSSVKNMLHINKKTKRFYKYMLSYILFVVTLLVITGSFINGSYLSALQREVEASNITALSQIRNVMDMRIKEMERVSVRISGNPGLTTFELTNGDDYSSFNAVRILNDYRSNNAFIYDIALYYSNNDTDRIYAASGTYSPEMFFDRVYNYEKFNKVDFTVLLDSMKFPVMRPVEVIKFSGFNMMNFATYICPLPINIGRPYGAVLFLIEENVLKNIVQDTLKEHAGFIYILNEKNEPVFSLSSENMKNNAGSILNILNLDFTDQRVSNIRAGNEQYSVVSLLSDFNKWKYITVMPTDQFLKKVNNSRTIFYYAVLLVLVLGILMSFFFANSNYKPLRNLVDALKRQTQNVEPQKNVDELDYIQNTIIEVNEKNQGLMSKLNSKVGMMKEQLVLTLLNGKVNRNMDVEDLLSLSGVKLDSPYFTVLLFVVDDYYDFIESNAESMQDIIKYSIINALEELSLEAGQGYGIDLADERGVVLLLNYNSKSDEQKITGELASKAMEFFKKYFNITFTVGIGNSYKDISRIHESFAEACSASYYRLVKGKDRVIYYKDLIKEHDSYQIYKFKFIVEQEVRLVMYIKQGKIEDAKQVIKDIVENLRKQNPSPETAQYVYFVLVNTVIRILNEMGIDEVECLGNDFGNLVTIRYDTIDMLEERLAGVCSKVCNHIEKQKKSRNTRLCDKIMNYVYENYYDNNLSVDNLAGMFNLSPSYITRFFKDQTGFSLKEYLDMLRMNKAKELLKSTGLTIREIIDRVGYIDETNFIRKFKKSENMTPAIYRNVVKK